MPDAEIPIEDRIEAASIGGMNAAKNGVTTTNPWPLGSPESSAWVSAFEANKPPPFDIVAYARKMGEEHAKAGPGFTPPYPIGTPERKAWQEAYNATPKGVPQTSGKAGVSEDAQIERVKAETITAADLGTVITTNPPKYEGPASGELPKTLADAEFWKEKPGKIMTDETGKPVAISMCADGAEASRKLYYEYGKKEPDPYTNMLAAAKRQGRAAREAEQPIGSNPYNAPESRLEGPAEAWAAGWRELDSEKEQRQIEYEIERMGTLKKSAKEFADPTPIVGELIRTEPVTRESIALAVYPLLLDMTAKNWKAEVKWEEMLRIASNDAVGAADALLTALKK